MIYISMKTSSYNYTYLSKELELLTVFSALVFTASLLNKFTLQGNQIIFSIVFATGILVMDFISISPTGQILLTNFIPWLSLGNIRKIRLSDALKNDLYKRLGDSNNLKGRCGYRSLREGYRAKALIENGDIFAEDPSCLIY